MDWDLSKRNTTLINTSSSLIGQSINSGRKPYKVNVSVSEDEYRDYADAVAEYSAAQDVQEKWNNAVSRQAKERENIIKLYRQFYTSGSYYDANGNLVTGQNAYDYADRYEFAEFLHSLYPDLSVDYFMDNAESFMEEATGVKADISTYKKHLGNIWNSTWASTWTAYEVFGNYLNYSLNGGFGTQAWENKKEEMAEKIATNGSSYRKDLGDEKYSSIGAKMISGTVQQMPQIISMLSQMGVSALTAGISGALTAGKVISEGAAKKALGTSQWTGRLATFLTSGLTEAGSSMLDLYQNGFSDKTALWAGTTIGLFTGLLETVGDETILKPLNKAADLVVGLKDTKVMDEAVKSFGRNLADFAVKQVKQVGTSMITEPAEEEAELLSNFLITNIAAAVERNHGRQVTGDKDWDEFWDEAKETLIETWYSTPLMSLAGGLAGAGVDKLLGGGSLQWTPSSYMKREGATNVVANANVVVSSPVLKVDTTKKDSGSKADPIKAHVVGSRVIVDEALSTKQNEALRTKKAIYITEDGTSRLITTPKKDLEKSAIDNGVTLTPEQAENFLVKADVDNKLKAYGYESKKELTAQNDGKATALYVEIKGIDEAIKITLSESATENTDVSTDPKVDPTISDETIQELKEITGIEYENFETVQMRNQRIKKTIQSGQTTPKATEQEEVDDEPLPESWKRETTQPAQPGDTTQQTDTTQTAPVQSAQQTTVQQTTDGSKKYKTDTAVSLSTFLQKYNKTQQETVELLDTDGNVITDKKKARFAAFTDADGAVKISKIPEGTKESVVNKLLSIAKNSSVDSKKAAADYAKDKNKDRQAAQQQVGIQPSTTIPTTIKQQEEDDKKTMAAKAAKAKKASDFFDTRNIEVQGKNYNVVAIEKSGYSTYEFIDDEGYTLDKANGKTVVVFRKGDGQESAYRVDFTNAEQAQAFNELASKMRQVGVEEADTGSVTEADYTKAVNTIEDSGVPRDAAEEATLTLVGINNALRQTGVKLSLDDAVSKVKENKTAEKLQKANSLLKKSNVIADTILTTDGVDSVLRTFYGDDYVDKSKWEEDYSDVAAYLEDNLGTLIYGYLIGAKQDGEYTDDQILFLDEIKDTVLALYENNKTTLSDEEMKEYKILKSEGEKKAVKYQSEVRSQDSAQRITPEEGQAVDTSKIASSFEYDTEKDMYYINPQGAYNEIYTTLVSAHNKDSEVDLDEIRTQARLGAIFLSSLSDTTQNAIVQKSIASDTTGNLIGNNENLLRMFFTFKESADKMPEYAKGASIPEAAKILLSSLSDGSTVVHETGHIIWNLDPDFRNRAQAAYKTYFEEDPDGVGIRTVVEADPDRFGGMTADTVIANLKRLTSGDFDYTKENGAEETIMYMFEAWDENRDTKEYIKKNNELTGLFERLKQFIKDVAEKIKNFFGVDILHETNDKVYAPLFDDVKKFKEFSRQAAEQEVSFENSKRSNVRQLGFSDDGSVTVLQADKSLILTHSLSSKKLNTQLDDSGKIAMPSIAIGHKDGVRFLDSDSALLIGNEELARKFLAEGAVYEGDIYSSLYPAQTTKFSFEKMEGEFENLSKDYPTLAKDIKRLKENTEIGLTSKELFENKDFRKMVLDYYFRDASKIQTPSPEEVSKRTNVFSELGEDFKDFYLSLIMDATREWLENDGTSLEDVFYSYLKQAVIEELHPEIFDYDAYTGDKTDKFLDLFWDKLPTSEFGKVNRIIEELEYNTNTYNLFQKKIEDALGVYGLSFSDLIANFETRFSTPVFEEDGSEVNAENALNIMSQKPLKGATAEFSNLLTFRTLAINQINNLDEAHSKESKISEKAGDFGNDRDLTRQYSAAYKEMEKSLRATLSKSSLDSIDVLDYATDWLTQKQGKLDGLDSALKSYLIENDIADVADEATRITVDGIKELYSIAQNFAVPYFEAKPSRIVNVSEFSTALVDINASEDLIKKLEFRGLHVIKFDFSKYNSENALSDMLNQITNSVKGRAKRVAFQTISQYLTEEQKNEVNKVAVAGKNRFEELIYQNIKSKMLAKDNPVQSWMAKMKKKEGFIKPSEISSLVTLLDRNGLFEDITSRDMDDAQKQMYKEDIAKRLVYEQEDYMTVSKKIGSLKKRLLTEDGDYVDEHSEAALNALYYLYGYTKYNETRVVDGKPVLDDNKKTVQDEKRAASGLLSTVFMRDNKQNGSYNSKAQPTLSKKFIKVRDSLDAKGIHLEITNDEIREFLRKTPWSPTAKSGMSIEGVNGKPDYKNADFKLEKKGLSTRALYEFMSLMVYANDGAYVPYAWHDAPKNLADGQVDNTYGIQGPLIDILNYMHRDIDEGTFSENSSKHTDAMYFTTAYNGFVNAGVPLIEGTISASPSLLDQYGKDYLGQYKMLMGNETLDYILKQGINVEDLETLKKSITEVATEKKAETKEVTEVAELFTNEAENSDFLTEVEQISQQLEQNQKDGIAISKDSLDRLATALRTVQTNLESEQAQEADARAVAIEEKHLAEEESLRAENEELKQQNTQLNNSNISWGRENDAIRAENISLRESNKELRQSYDTLTQQNEELTVRNKRLLDMNQRRNEEVVEIAQENADLQESFSAERKAFKNEIKDVKSKARDSEKAIRERYKKSLAEQATRAAKELQEEKDNSKAKLEKQKNKYEDIVKEKDEKIQKRDEKLEKKDARIKDLVANRIDKRKRALEIVESILTSATKVPEDLSEDAKTAVKAISDLVRTLKNEVNSYANTTKKLQTQLTELQDRLSTELNIADSTAKDFDNAGLLPMFNATVKEMKNVARNSGTAEVSNMLTNFLNIVSKKVNIGTEVDMGELFDYRKIFTSDKSDKYNEYRGEIKKLGDWFKDNMTTDKGATGAYGRVITKTLKQLTAKELSEVSELVSKVAKVSREYFNNIVEKDNDYFEKWKEAINDEINTFAIERKGKNLAELSEEDSLGAGSAKKGWISGKVGELINDFTLNSVKYRDRFPTLYAFIFGGIDHEGNVYGGLNGAVNKVDGDFRKDVDALNKIVIEKLSGTMFYGGELTEKNLRNKWNAVKSTFKTQLGMVEFTDEIKKSIGYKIESFIDPTGIKRYQLALDEDSSSAMKEVARFLGNIDIQRLKAIDKLKDLNTKIDKKRTAIDNNKRTIANAKKNLEYWRTGKYYVTGEKFGQLIDEKDRQEHIAILEARIKKYEDILEKNQTVLEARLAKIPVLQQRIKSYESRGVRPNINETQYTTQELLGIYMYARQEGGLNHLIYTPTIKKDGADIAGSSNTNNLDIGNVLWVIQQFENPNSEYAPLKEVADELSELVSKNFEEVRKTKFYLSNGQVLLDPIEHYFKFITDTSLVTDIQDQIDLGGMDDKAEKKPDSKSMRAKANDSMTKERTNPPRGLELKVLDRAYSALYQQEYYISMGKNIERLKQLIGDDGFQTAMKNYYGRNKGVANIQSLSKYVNALSNTQKDLDPTALSGFVRFFTNNTAVGAMAFSLPTVLQQIPTVIWCLKDPHIGLKGVAQALYRSATDKSLYQYSPQMQERANSALQSIRATKNIGTFFGEKFGNYKIEQIVSKTQDIGLYLLEKADAYIANAMWYATFEGVKSEYASLDPTSEKYQRFTVLSADKQMELIANEATQRVMDISPVQGGKDNATAYSTSNALIRNLLLFTNQTNKMLNGIVGGVRDLDVKGGKYLGKVIGVSLAIFMLNGIINGKLWRKTKDDDDDEAEVNLLRNIPYVITEGAIDLIPNLDSLLSSDQYGETNIATDFTKLINVITKDPDERTENQMANAWANLVTDAFSASGLPGNQLRKTYRSVRDRNPMQFYNSKYGELLED